MDKLKYGGDTEISIAIGKSRRELHWKNQTITWSKLVERLSATYKTHETMAEFLKMTRDEQDSIKDIGGFVAGELKEGRRKNGDVLSRSIITLDADFAPKDLWDSLEIESNYALCAYSTHKHTPQKPRLRILIPLDRKVSPEEYEAISRKVAKDIGIDYFDDTTYEAARLMFWPSTPKDIDFFFGVIDAPFINADELLATYPNWRDASYWPESSRGGANRAKLANKQGDPLTKTGLIGAFCRTYTIDEAIANFIPNDYVNCDKPNRYTYTKGSTAAGLVVYDGKFAYSNHGTDPSGGQLCNAFDLVRIHKFGSEDLESATDTPTQKLPSWKSMMEFCSFDENVKLEIGKEKLERANVEVTDTEWLKSLTTNNKGAYNPTIDNIAKILRNDPNLKGLGRKNSFSGRREVSEKLPWTRNAVVWSDADDAALRNYIENVYEIDARNKITDAVAIVFEERTYHPVREYLNGITWDKTPRVDTLLIDYLGADDNEYVRTVTRKTLVAAVKRIFEPGCKFDYMLTIVGEQGIGKSYLISRMGKGWASDTLTDIKGKESYEALDGVWIMEMGELAALKKSEREAIKAYISKQVDTYRKAFAQNVSINPRQCIFVGTTNDEAFLNDPTGARRFWVVNTKKAARKKLVWEHLTDEEIDQIWAEACELYHSGENPMQMNENVYLAAQAQQKAHAEVDPFQGIVEDFVSVCIPQDWYKKTIAEQQSWYQATEDYKNTEKIDTIERTRVCALEIWCVALGRDKSAMSYADTRRINACLDGMANYEKNEKAVRFGCYGMQRGYSKKGEW